MPGVTATAQVTVDGPPPTALPAIPLAAVRALHETLDRQNGIREACEAYSRAQVAAFAQYRTKSEAAWMNYNRAMLAAEAEYDASMTIAGTDYDQAVSRHA